MCGRAGSPSSSCSGTGRSQRSHGPPRSHPTSPPALCQPRGHSGYTPRPSQTPRPAPALRSFHHDLHSGHCPLLPAARPVRRAPPTTGCCGHGGPAAWAPTVPDPSPPKAFPRPAGPLPSSPAAPQPRPLGAGHQVLRPAPWRPWLSGDHAANPPRPAARSTAAPPQARASCAVRAVSGPVASAQPLVTPHSALPGVTEGSRAPWVSAPCSSLAASCSVVTDWLAPTVPAAPEPGLVFLPP